MSIGVSTIAGVGLGFEFHSLEAIQTLFPESKRFGLTLTLLIFHVMIGV